MQSTRDLRHVDRIRGHRILPTAKQDCPTPKSLVISIQTEEKIQNVVPPTLPFFKNQSLLLMLMWWSVFPKIWESSQN